MNIENVIYYILYQKKIDTDWRSWSTLGFPLSVSIFVAMMGFSNILLHVKMLEYDWSILFGQYGIPYGVHELKCPTPTFFPSNPPPPQVNNATFHWKKWETKFHIFVTMLSSCDSLGGLLLFPRACLPTVITLKLLVILIKESLESKDWFPKVIIYAVCWKGEFCQDKCLKEKNARNPAAVLV